MIGMFEIEQHQIDVRLDRQCCQRFLAVMGKAEAVSSFADVAAEALLSDNSKSASSSTARMLAVLIEQNYSSQSALLALTRQLLRRSGELGAAVARITSDTGRVDDMLPRRKQRAHCASSKKSKQRKMPMTDLHAAPTWCRRCH